MPEKKFFHEGTYAVTSDRLIWGDGGYDLSEFDDTHIVDWHSWVGTSAVLVVMGLVALALSSFVFTVIGLALFAGAFAMYYYRHDKLLLFKKGEIAVTLSIKRDKALMERISGALSKRRDWLRAQHKAATQEYAASALDEIANLPE